MRRLIAPLLACALVLSSVGAVSAQPEEFQFDPVACAIFFGGEITVEPGADIVLFSGWSAATRGQLESFSQAATWILTVNGRAVDVTPYFDPLTKLDRKFWLTIWRVPVGSLELGETVDLTLDLVQPPTSTALRGPPVGVQRPAVVPRDRSADTPGGIGDQRPGSLGGESRAD